MRLVVEELLKDTHIYKTLVIYYVTARAIEFFDSAEDALKFFLCMAKAQGLSTQIVRRAFYKTFNLKMPTQTGYSTRTATTRNIIDCYKLYVRLHFTVHKKPITRADFIDLQRANKYRALIRPHPKQFKNVYYRKENFLQYQYDEFMHRWTKLPIVLDDEERDTLAYVIDRMFTFLREIYDA